jgi:post-segregation antitoxin (ccd killing protein)
MQRFVRRSAPKRAASVSIRCDLLDAAHIARVNLSAMLEHALIDDGTRRRALKTVKRLLPTASDAVPRPELTSARFDR